jgi:hypothetical protein
MDLLGSSAFSILPEFSPLFFHLPTQLDLDSHSCGIAKLTKVVVILVPRKRRLSRILGKTWSRVSSLLVLGVMTKPEP